jgi:hypothetical protein
MSERIERIKKAIEAREGCRSTHVQSLPVKEVSDRQTVWEGVVETFDLHNHATAKRAYAWEQWVGEKEPRYTVVLGIPPVNSANDAVKAAVVAHMKEVSRKADQVVE